MLHKDAQTILEGRDPSNIEQIKITAYEPAFGIIGDPAKRNPQTRQSADHSMVYIIATLLRKAFHRFDRVVEHQADPDELWKTVMLTPLDYNHHALFDETTRALMDKIVFEHGGPEYDSKYPEGIPTSVAIKTKTRE
jgi:2-methylcitrate dehydratase